MTQKPKPKPRPPKPPAPPPPEPLQPRSQSYGCCLRSTPTSEVAAAGSACAAHGGGCQIGVQTLPGYRLNCQQGWGLDPGRFTSFSAGTAVFALQKERYPSFCMPRLAFAKPPVLPTPIY